MIKNDFSKDISRLSIQSGIKKREVSRIVGTSPQYISVLVNQRNIINKIFVKVVEAFGYDIKIEYIKRDSDISDIK